MKYNIAMFLRNRRSVALEDFSEPAGDASESRPEPLCAALNRNRHCQEKERQSRKRLRIPITQELSEILSISGKFR